MEINYNVFNRKKKVISDDNLYVNPSDVLDLDENHLTIRGLLNSVKTAKSPEDLDSLVTTSAQIGMIVDDLYANPDAYLNNPVFLKGFVLIEKKLGITPYKAYTLCEALYNHAMSVSTILPEFKDLVLNIHPHSRVTYIKNLGFSRDEIFLILLSAYSSYDEGVAVVNLNSTLMNFKKDNATIKNICQIYKLVYPGVDKVLKVFKAVMFDIYDDSVLNNTQREIYQNISVALLYYLGDFPPAVIKDVLCNYGTYLDSRKYTRFSVANIVEPMNVHNIVQYLLKSGYIL